MLEFRPLLLLICTCAVLLTVSNASKDTKAAMIPCKEMNCFFCRVPKIQTQCPEKCGQCTEVARHKREDDDSPTSNDGGDGDGGDTNDGGSSENNGGGDYGSDNNGGSDYGNNGGGDYTSEEHNEVTEPPKKSSKGSSHKTDDENDGESSSGGGGGGGNEPWFHPKVAKEEANKRFMHCCKAMSNFPSACHSTCKYDVTLDELGATYMNNEKCGLSQMNRYLSCASDEEDNTKCCEEAGVLEGRKQCAPFCAGTAKTVGLEHQQCGPQLEKIMKCHWNGLKAY